MVVHRLDILQRVITIVDIDQEVQKILIDNGISSAGNLLNATYKAYQYLVDKKNSKLFAVYKDKSFIF